VPCLVTALVNCPAENYQSGDKAPHYNPTNIIRVRFMSAFLLGVRSDFRKFFALTDAAGLESRLLVRFSQQPLSIWRLHLFTREPMTKLPHPPPTNFW
jgi:hypothetical protein